MRKKALVWMMAACMCTLYAQPAFADETSVAQVENMPADAALAAADQAGAGGTQQAADEAGAGASQQAADQAGAGASQQPVGPGYQSQTAVSDSLPKGPGYALDGQPLEPGGSGQAGTGQAGAGQILVDNGFLQLEVPNPIVQTVDKYSYDFMANDLYRLQTQYGNRMTTRVIGVSADGRNLFEVIVGNPNAPKHILIHAGIHAREHMTTLLVMKQMEYALAYYDQGTYLGRPLSEMFNQVAVHFVPMINPDGTSISQFGLEGIRSEELRQVVMNCYQMDVAEGRTSQSLDQYLTLWKANAKGVDLNRNFDASWSGVADTVNRTSYSGYKGPAPVSEPESLALYTLASSRQWNATISYHAMGEVIYWNGVGNRVGETSMQLAQNAAALTGYQVISENGQGGFKDWMQCRDNPVASITIEIGRNGCPLPVSQFPAIWAQNKGVWLQTMAFVLNTGL